MLGIVCITIIYPAPYCSIPTVELNTTLVSSGARPTRRDPQSSLFASCQECKGSHQACAAACTALTACVGIDALHTALLPERTVVGEAVARLASFPWSQSAEPGFSWTMGIHLSSQAPVLAAVLLGDVESEDGGVALSPPAVGALVLGMTTALAHPSGSGTYLWPVSRAKH